MLTKSALRKVPRLSQLLNVETTLAESPRWAPIEIQPYQRTPEGDWHTWMFVAGRDTGKTLVGSNWCVEELRTQGRAARVGVMAPTQADAIGTCAEGETGLITLFGSEFPRYNRSAGEAWHYLGGYVRFMGSERPDRWRGPQWTKLWIDEAASCVHKSIQVADFTVRLGDRPRQLWTSTPKPGIRWFKEQQSRPGVAVTRATIYDNRFASRAAVERLEGAYKGTSLGRSELLGEDVDIPEGAIWPMLGLRREHYLRPFPEEIDGVTNRLIRAGSGVDWGMTEAHKAAVISGGNLKDGVIWIRRAWSSGGGNSQHLIAALARHKAEIGVTFAAIDRSQWSIAPWVEDSRKDTAGQAIGAGLIALKGSRAVDWRAALVLAALEQHRLFFDSEGDSEGDGVATAYDFLTQYHRDEDGKIVEVEDDYPDALCYLIAELLYPGGGAPPKGLELRGYPQEPPPVTPDRFSETPRGPVEPGGLTFRGGRPQAQGTSRGTV